MNKKILTGLFVFVIMAVAGVIYLGIQSESNTPEQNVQSSQQQTEPTGFEATESQPAAPREAYRDYNEAEFANTPGKRIVFFHAPWCFQCRELDKDIKANLTSIPDNVTIFKIDHDSNQELRQKYGVTMRTTFVAIDESGKNIASFVAYDEPTFANLQKNIL